MKKKLIIGLSGLAGSGKDFIADLLVEKYEFAKLALADPLKRICKEVFDFSDQQLWGPSEERNHPDKRYFTGKSLDSIVDYEDARIFLMLDNAIEDTKILMTPDNTIEKLRPKEPTEEEIKEKCKIYLTPRMALQQLGTEWGRNCYPNVWTDYTLRVANKLLSGPWQYDPRHGIWGFEECSPVPDGIVISDVRFKNEFDAVKKAGGKLVRIKGYKDTTLRGRASLHSSEQEQKTISDSEFDYVLQNKEDVDALYADLKEMLKVLSE